MDSASPGRPYAVIVVFGGFRRWVAGFDARAILVLHLTRFVGVYFLLLNASHVLLFWPIRREVKT